MFRVTNCRYKSVQDNPRSPPCSNCKGLLTDPSFYMYIPLKSFADHGCFFFRRRPKILYPIVYPPPPGLFIHMPTSNADTYIFMVYESAPSSHFQPPGGGCFSRARFFSVFLCIGI